MNSSSYDIMKLLGQETNGLGLTQGSSGTTPLGHGEWMAITDKIQILVVEGVAPPSHQFDLVEIVAVQVLVRGAKRDSEHKVYKKAFDIYSYLLDLPDSFVSQGNEYKGMEASSNLAPLGRDEEERFTYSMNFISYR